MSTMTLIGIVAVLAGIAILIWPTLLNVVVALALIIGGVLAISRGMAAAQGP